MKPRAFAATKLLLDRIFGRIADRDAAAAGERAELEAVQRELEAAARDREPHEAERAIAEAERRRDLTRPAHSSGAKSRARPSPSCAGSGR